MPIVLLLILFAEPRVDKAHVGKQEENLRSCKNCRHVYSLPTGAAAVPAGTLYSLMVEQVDAA